MIYDVIIIGGGAAGLFAGASLPKENSALILEKSKSPGKKLILSGALQCNLTHDGNIKDFLNHYGQHGKKIRGILYGYNNEKVMDYFRGHGVKCFTRADGKVFPVSLKSQDVLDSLLKACARNNVDIICNSQVTAILASDEKLLTESAEDNVTFYSVICGTVSYKTKKVIIATGGASYPTTGSDGSFFTILKDMGVAVVPPAPSLVPVKVHDYPYSELSGLSFENVEFSVEVKSVEAKSSCKKDVKLTDDLLFTHNSFSGPCVLNTSRYIKAGDKISIDYLPQVDYNELLKQLKSLAQGNSKQVTTFLLNSLENSLPKRFIEILCTRLHIDFTRKASSLSGDNLKSLLFLLKQDTFSVSGLGGFNLAMATNGGVSLDEINLKNLEIKKYPGLHVIGEALDIDGDTGGYNLQFAFSSAFAASSKALNPTK